MTVSGITNCYEEAVLARPKLPSVRTTIYRPVEGWSYAHHPFLCSFGGMLIAAWSCGRRNEDDVGQRVLYAHTARESAGSWSAPRPLADVGFGMAVETTKTAAGFHICGDTLVAYYGAYEHQLESVQNGHVVKGKGRDRHSVQTYAMVSKDGLTFSAPTPIGIPMIPNQAPIQLASGRLLFCANYLFAYADDPAGLRGWKKTGPCACVAGGIETVVDHSGMIDDMAACMGLPGMICEGSCFQEDGGRIHAFFRTRERILYHCQSEDDAENWTKPAPIAFTNNSTKFKFGRLPDGRCYCVGSPDPYGNRNPLALMVSQDGVRFDRHFLLRDEPCEQRFAGDSKGGVYAYPDVCFFADSMYIIYSVQKECVEVTKVRLCDIR